MAVGTHPLPTDLFKTCTEGMVYCFSQWAFDVTNGLWWTALLLGFCIALYASVYSLPGARPFGFASFVGLLGSIMLAVLNLIPWAYASIFIITGIVGLGAMIMSER